MSDDKPSDITWVVGAGGLLGGALSSQIRRSGGLVHRELIPWADAEQSVKALAEGFGRMMGRARAHEARWRIAWCAGAGVTSSSETTLSDEVRVFTRFLEAITDAAPSGRGSLFLASSAGGIYAGASDPPFTEHHTPRPISAYGEAKLAMERVATQFSEQAGVPVLIGRIANLYGPAQNLAKPQGLISHICRMHLLGQPISIYVPLDTIRNYLFVEDCGAMVADALDELTARPGYSTVKIFGSRQGTTVAALLGECKRVFKRAPRVVLGNSPNAQFQAKDLRLSSVVWPSLDRRALTPLPVGISSTVSTLLRSIQLAV